jgi:hypothetical protein
MTHAPWSLFLFDLDEQAATQLPSMPADLQSNRATRRGCRAGSLGERDHSASGSGRRQSFSGGKTFSGGRPSASRLMMRWRSRMTSPPGITSARRSPEGPCCTLLARGVPTAACSRLARGRLRPCDLRPGRGLARSFPMRARLVPHKRSTHPRFPAKRPGEPAGRSPFVDTLRRIAGT